MDRSGTGAVAGRCVQAAREQLVALQVPGLKELQAILHRQDFLQTLHDRGPGSGSFQLSHETCSITDCQGKSKNKTHTQ